ncbi:trichohyalin-like isoform X4 [Scylla paramamosain]|uniref:trichohyalin-like isoform X4 n=1 Tax=Scylla paramamosain TaxID=85552 RepID=UPI003083232B
MPEINCEVAYLSYMKWPLQQRLSRRDDSDLMEYYRVHHVARLPDLQSRRLGRLRMPKGSDPLCPLGFHPQTRWPNRCKRCFRDYNDHKTVKEQSGSTTSLNSLSGYDTSTKEKEEGSAYRRTRSDLSAEIISRANAEASTEGRKSSWYSNSSKSWNKSRPVSWSAQDLRAAVDEAKEQVRSSREDLHRLYGSTKSLTGDYDDLRSTSNNLSSSKDEKDPTASYSSFSSYLAMRTKSPARPPLARASSLQGTSSTSSYVRRNDEETAKITEEKEEPKYTKPTTETKTSKPPTLSSVSESKSSTSSSLPPISETPRSRNSTSNSDAKPPKPPSRLRPSIKLGEIKETRTEEKPDKPEKSEKPKNILMLRGEVNGSGTEVKSEDESVDASYVIKLKPKKEPKRVEIDLQSEVDRLQKELKEKTKQVEELSEKTDTLERENKELLAKKPKFGDLRKQAELSKVQQKVDELTEEIKSKNKEIKELKKEIDKRPLPKDVEKTIEDLRSKLQAAEQLCEELMDETEDYKKEIRTLEDEIEEMQDNFREEQADEYRDLKRELEQTAKNCRVLQFKLKKAERRSESLERDKGEIEDKLKELQVGEGDVDRAEKVKMLEKEVNLAKEVSVKMHEEMQKMKEQLESAERDKKKLSEKFMDKPVRPGGKLSRSQMMGRQGSQDNTEQLMRDLQGATEREQDLKDQLKFAEEETKNLRKKTSRLEEENETLALQLKKMSTKAKQNRQRSMERSGSIERAGSVERGSLSRQGSTEKPPKEPDEGITEDLDPTELKIQLELNEQESAVLRRKVEDLESENERLQKEIRGVLSSTDSRVIKGDSADMKKLEKEVQLLRTKINDVEAENEKLSDENKKLQLRVTKRLPLSGSETSYIEKQVQEEKVKRLEKKLKEANDKLKEAQIEAAVTSTEGKGVRGVGLKDETPKKDVESDGLKKKLDDLQTKYDKLFKETEELRNPASMKNRIPKVPKDYTPKATLMKWVTELEAECAKLHSSLVEADKRKKTRPTSEDLTSVRDLEDKLNREKERNEELSRQLQEEREKLDKPLPNKRRFGSNEDDLKRYEERISTLKEQLSQEKERNDELKTKLGEGSRASSDELRASKTENSRLQRELKSAQETSAVLERKLKETEENLKTTERTERKNRVAAERLEAKLEEERSKGTVAEERQKELTVSWLKERDDLKKELAEAKRSKEKFERDVRTFKRERDNMETKLEEEKKRAEEAQNNKRKDTDDLKTLKRRKEELENELDDLRDSVTQLESTKEKNIQKHKREVDNLKKENDNLTIRMNGLESELKSEKRRRERLEKDSNSFRERTNARNEEELKKVKEELDTLQTTHKELERTRKKEKQQMEALQTKYDLLEEDFVVQKAQYTTNKEGVEEKYEKLKKEHSTIETELKNLRETYNNRQDTWIKEKLGMQDQLRELEVRLKKVSNDPTSYSEKKRLKDIIDDKNHQIDQLKRDEDTLKDQVSYYRRESEDLRRKVEDLEKLQQINEKRASDIASDASTYDNTIRELRDKLTANEKTHKTDLTKIKMKYDSKLKAMTEEVSTLTQHMTKYRRERDTYKEMLDGSQRTIAELKGSGNYKASRADNASEMAGGKRQVDQKAQQHLLETQELHAQVTEFEDKLADAKLENTKLKNEIIDQKTNFEIQLCDLQTKVNEYEESRLLVGNARRLPGLRTRLELNWQKEREEQQRLIQETATLAKDLRQTLYEVERERDLEKLEAKRKIDQLKKTVGQETSDTKTKVQELQRDLQELREAHAKLRQINEKLRREKDRTEVEREAMRDKYLGSSREHLHQQSKMELLAEEMKVVKDLAPLVLGEGIDGREGSLTKLTGEVKPKTREEFTDSLRKACKCMEDLKRIMNLTDDRDRFKRAPSFRRALSDMESEDESVSIRPRSQQRGSLHKGPKNQRSMYRKTQSLDHQMAEDRGKIWVSTDAGSTTSIDSTLTDDMRRAKYDRDISMDRISTGSQTSELDALADKKKKKGVKAMFSKLTKSRSIEESGTGGSIVGAGVKAMGVGMGGSGSDISTTEMEKESKVKGKLKSLFRSGPPNRSQSVERDTAREGPNAKSSGYDSKTGSIASLESEAGSTLPPVLQRYRGRADYGAMTKAQSISSIGRRSSVETEV